MQRKSKIIGLDVIDRTNTNCSPAPFQGRVFFNTPLKNSRVSPINFAKQCQKS